MVISVHCYCNQSSIKSCQGSHPFIFHRLSLMLPYMIICTRVVGSEYINSLKRRDVVPFLKTCLLFVFLLVTWCYADIEAAVWVHLFQYGLEKTNVVRHSWNSWNDWPDLDENHVRKLFSLSLQNLILSISSIMEDLRQIWPDLSPNV